MGYLNFANKKQYINNLTIVTIVIWAIVTVSIVFRIVLRENMVASFAGGTMVRFLGIAISLYCFISIPGWEKNGTAIWTLLLYFISMGYDVTYLDENLY